MDMSGRWLMAAVFGEAPTSALEHAAHPLHRKVLIGICDFLK